MTSVPARAAPAWMSAFASACFALAAHGAPDEALLGRAAGYPAGAPERLAEHLVGPERPQHLVASFGGALEAALPLRRVPRGPAVQPLPRADTPASLAYSHEGQRLTLDDYLERQRVTGLLVIKDGRIVAERYQYGRDERTRFLSASMAKTIVGLLVGIAIEEGRIRSLDDLARTYVPALAGHPYGETSIRDLLAMSSGVRFSEQYDGQGDLADLIRTTIGRASPGGAAVLRPYTQRRSAPGTLFYYSSADTQALGLVLRGATGMPVADYFATRLWQPLGAEDDASWLLDAEGQEATFAFLHARLRDFGRLGLLVANEGRVDGRQVVPAAWLRLATAPAGAHAQPYIASAYFGYGLHFWTFPEGRGRVAFLGARGQAIFVDPASRLVLVQSAVWRDAGDRAARAELLALWRGLLDHYGAP